MTQTSRKKRATTSVDALHKKTFFDALGARYGRGEWLHSDPVQFVHRYADPDDQEVAGFIAALFAYGSVVLILRAAQAILEPMGPHPARFLREWDGKSRWKGFSHRFHKEPHVLALLKVLSRVLKENGSLGEFFKLAYDIDKTLEGMLSEVAETFQGEFKNQPEILRGLKFLINTPSDGSACKRMVMFLRWMVRKDEVDVGLWTWLSPSELVIPVDTHIAKLSWMTGLRKSPRKRAPNWKMAVEITDSLRHLNPNDPVCYDFALTRLGILDVCRNKWVPEVCQVCPVRPVCRIAKGK